MMTFSKRSLLAAVAACALAAPAAQAQTKTVKIGSIFALTGPNASIGKEQLDGSKYAIEKLNKSGGVSIGGETYRFELVNIDDESRPERSVAAAERLIGVDNVAAILMPASSTTALAVAPIAEKNKRIALNFVAAAPQAVRPELTFSFRSTLTSIMNVSPSVEYLIKQKGVKTIAYLGRNDDWGRAAGQSIAAKAQELGANVVVNEYFEAGSTDFYGLLTKVRAARPDAVVAAAFTEDGVAMLKQYRELQMRPIFLSVAVIWASPPFLAAAGDAAEGIYVSTGPTTTKSPELDAFKAEFKAATGQEALPFGITGFDNVNLLVEAMKKAGSTDPEKVAPALRQLEFKGLLQNYRFAGTNQSDVTINVNEIKGGKVDVISSHATR